MGKTTMKAAKKKRVSIIARGKRAKAAVFLGRKQKTVSGVTKEGLMKNSLGKVVSKKSSARAKRFYEAGNGFKKWIEACRKARKALKVKGFVAIGGNTAVGKALYRKAKSLL